MDIFEIILIIILGPAVIGASIVILIQYCVLMYCIVNDIIEWFKAINKNKKEASNDYE